MPNTPTTKLKVRSPVFLALLSLPILLFSFPAIAQTNQNIIDQQDWISRNQQSQIEEQRRIREEESIREERKRLKKEERAESAEESLIYGQSSECFTIESIYLHNAHSISRKTAKNLTAPFLGRCLDSDILSEVIDKINSYYNKKGLVTARVSVPKQNIRSGFLELDIFEGKIAKITLGNDKFTDKMQKFTAFGNIKGDILNINEINQGIYQINRLPSNKAALKIEPGTKTGEANVIIANNKKFPARATIGQSNLGNDLTGVRRSNFSASFDNLLSLNDNINLTHSANLNDESRVKDIRSISGDISIPFKFNTFSYSYYRSEFRGTNSGVKLTGYSDSNSITFDRLFLNNGKLRISANSSLTAKRTASYLNSVKIETSERKLSIANISLASSAYFKNGISLYLKPSYSKGLKILNSKQDQKNIPTSNPKAQFELFKLYASISKKFTIPKLNTHITLTSEMDSQFAKETLFGTEQFSVGGYYSVRGFRETYISGDSGYYFRNKANFNVGSLVKKDNFTFLNKLSLEPFYDYGYIQNKYDGSDGRLSGAGIRSIFSSNYFNASLTYSWALNKSSLISSTTKENKLLYFEISATCC